MGGDLNASRYDMYNREVTLGASRISQKRTHTVVPLIRRSPMDWTAAGFARGRKPGTHRIGSEYRKAPTAHTALAT